MNIPLNQQKKNSNPIGILLHIPVPWVFVLSFLVGLVPQIILPIHIKSQGLILYIKIAGVLLFVIGAIIAAWSLIIFHKANTTTTPGEISKKLIISGPYRFTRNPMYISLTLAYLGEAGFLIQAWPLIILPLTLSYINWIVIPLEEDLLKKEFKEQFEIYCNHVNRWI
jgi:protein-S-isoprenylcysteine O-methyltransferase Ste14